MRDGVARGAAAGGAVLLGAAVVYYLREKATPGPGYRVLMSDGEFELRAYPEVTVAETVVSGPRHDALNEGYRILSDYLTARSRPGGSARDAGAGAAGRRRPDGERPAPVRRRSRRGCVAPTLRHAGGCGH